MGARHLPWLGSPALRRDLVVAVRVAILLVTLDWRERRLAADALALLHQPPATRVTTLTRHDYRYGPSDYCSYYNEQESGVQIHLRHQVGPVICDEVHEVFRRVYHPLAPFLAGLALYPSALALAGR